MRRFVVGTALLVSGCTTTIGSHKPEALESFQFASQPPVELRICVYLDNGLSRESAEKLLRAWNEEEGAKYNVYVRPVTFKNKKRQGTFYGALKEETRQLAILPQCDRSLWFIGRNVSDYLYGLMTLVLPLPEILGYVDDETLTRGYVVAKIGSVGQAILSAPKDATIHEIYHLLGCYEHNEIEQCYQRINELKTTFLHLKASGYYARVGEPDFFPTYVGPGNVIVVTRKQILWPPVLKRWISAGDTERHANGASSPPAVQEEHPVAAGGQQGRDLEED